MNYFKKIIRFAKPYKKFAYLNIFFNILYALFSTLSFVALIPVLQVIFGDNKLITKKPVFKGITHIKDFAQDSLNYFLSDLINEKGSFYALMVMVSVIITLFLLKNLSNYMAMFYITFLRNGVLKDIRTNMYNKIVSLPLSFYSEKKKGDTISRVSGDVEEVRNSILSVLEMVVREPLTILFSLIFMFFFSMKLTLFVFIFIPIAGFVIAIPVLLLGIGSKLIWEQLAGPIPFSESTSGGPVLVEAHLYGTIGGLLTQLIRLIGQRRSQHRSAILSRSQTSGDNDGVNGA